MARKAALFGDTTRHHQIMTSSGPAQQRALGRSVFGFDDDVRLRHFRPLITSDSIRLYVQFLGRTSPTAALAVWARIVPPGTMQHPIFLGRDSSMRFEQRLYTTLPHQPPGPLLGELSLLHHDLNRAATFIPDGRSTDDVYHLRYAGTRTTSLSTTPTLVEVNLVRQSGAPAFTGNYLVDMLPRDDPPSDTAFFVSGGHKTIPFSGSTELEPEDFLGTSSSPSVQVPIAPCPTLPWSPLRPFPPPTYLPSTTTFLWPARAQPQQTLPHRRTRRAPTSLHASTPINKRVSCAFGTVCHNTFATSPSASTAPAGHHRPSTI